MLLEMTTASFFGKSELVPLGPLTRFLKLQQPQIHITVCWFLSLCYADYVRKHYCQRFNLPYLEQWLVNVDSWYFLYHYNHYIEVIDYNRNLFNFYQTT